eukprot:CAMPEP_0119516852 /NCGR_PEP_ID=MMETSP1344-20130328/33926_1 /TAXON_ID=236787 /ORGANISM="Florenciella parvula, Strain CCMP2471" /LENGTH=203 /DNA_ID=CAMNT_0007554387 /DNA_START=89 /DNA_END=700 /DNA_ORIENTATION=+
MLLGVLEMTTRFVRDPIRIVADRRDELTLDGIKQFYTTIEREEWKLETLCDLFEAMHLVECTQTIIYCNTSRKVDWLTARIVRLAPLEAPQRISSIHGGMDQWQYDTIVRNFRSGSCRVLILTDNVIVRQAMPMAPLVINYDLPTNHENYLNRIGRNGRSDRDRRKGVAINFLTQPDVRFLREIEQFYNTQVDEMPMDVAGLI